MERVLCAICGIDDTEVLATKGDLTEDLTNVLCRRCGLVYINPRPTVAAYEAFHVEDFLAERHGIHSTADVAHKVGGADEALKQTIVDFLKPRLVPGVRVLDVGCGIGTFLHLVRKQVPDAILEGIELSTVDVQAAKEFYGLDVFAGSLGEYVKKNPGARFDIITLHHTFEHFPEPRAELERMKQMLTPGGSIYIAVPNIMDIRKRPEIFFQKGHPYSYSPATLRRILDVESYGVTAFHAPAGFPGGMELLAEPRPMGESELSQDELSAGGTPDAVRKSVQQAGQRFSRLRNIRDRLLFFLPERQRVHLTRWFYLLTKNRQRQAVLWGAVLSALLTGAVFVLPYAVMWASAHLADETFTFFSFINPDAFVNLAPMVRDVIDGHWWVGDGRVVGPAGYPNLWSSISPLFLAPLALLPGGVSTAFLLGHFLFPAVGGVAAFFLARRVSRQTFLAVLFSAITVTAGIVWTLVPPSSLEDVRLLGRSFFLGSPPGEILISKSVSFGVTPGIAFFFATALAVSVAMDRKQRRYGVMAGLLLGVLSTVYVTHALYLSAGLLATVALAVVCRQRFILRQSLWIVLGAVCGGVLTIVRYVSVMNLPHADELMHRVGGEFTHMPRFSHIVLYLAVIGWVVFLLWWGKRTARTSFALVVAGWLIATIIVLNIQVITGFNPAPSSWRSHQYFLGWGFAVWILVVWLTTYRPRLTTFLATVAFLTLLARVIQTEVVWTRPLNTAHRLPDAQARAMVWINNNLPRDSVIASPSLVTNTLIPVWTHAAVVLPAAVTSPLPIGDIENRWVCLQRLFAVSPDRLEAHLDRRAGPLDAFAWNQEDNIIIFLRDSFDFSNRIDAFFHKRSLAFSVDVRQRLLSRITGEPVTNLCDAKYAFVGSYERRLMTGPLDFPVLYNDSEGGVQILQLHP